LECGIKIGGEAKMTKLSFMLLCAVTLASTSLQAQEARYQSAPLLRVSVDLTGITGTKPRN
jgi:hypothetical protein